MASHTPQEVETAVDFQTFRDQVLNDYRLACLSRESSLLGRKEVLTGKAKFGIFGDGKELAQIALAKQFRDGDFRWRRKRAVRSPVADRDAGQRGGGRGSRLVG